MSSPWVTLRDGRIVDRSTWERERAARAAKTKPKTAATKKITRTAPRERTGLSMQSFTHLLPPLEHFEGMARSLADQDAGLVCRECGCTDANPCVDEDTGETCGWASDDLCTFCDPDSEDYRDPGDGAHAAARHPHAEARRIAKFQARERQDVPLSQSKRAAIAKRIVAIGEAVREKPAPGAPRPAKGTIAAQIIAAGKRRRGEA
jgi:hypothetical protein